MVRSHDPPFDITRPNSSTLSSSPKIIQTHSKNELTELHLLKCMWWLVLVLRSMNPDYTETLGQPQELLYTM